MNLLSRFTKPDYLSGEDFLKNYSYTVPKGFNFVRDVMGTNMPLWCPRSWP